MLNHIVIMGRLTRDPELRKTQSGTSVASFTLAVDRDLTPKGGEKETDFIDCVAWENPGRFTMMKEDGGFTMMDDDGEELPL